MIAPTDSTGRKLNHQTVLKLVQKHADSSQALGSERRNETYDSERASSSRHRGGGDLDDYQLLKVKPTKLSKKEKKIKEAKKALYERGMLNPWDNELDDASSKLEGSGSDEGEGTLSVAARQHNMISSSCS